MQSAFGGTTTQLEREGAVLARCSCNFLTLPPHHSFSWEESISLSTLSTIYVVVHTQTQGCTVAVFYIHFSSFLEYLSSLLAKKQMINLKGEGTPF